MCRLEDERVMEELKLKEGFYRHQVDWSRLVDGLDEHKKLVTRMTDHEDRDDTRDITQVGKKRVNLSVECFGLNPRNETYAKYEKKLLKKYRKIFGDVPLRRPIRTKSSCTCTCKK